MTQRDRDKSVEQWLRQTPVPGAQADDCLDAETLAVWAEGLLEGPQRATAEAHASNCARCQAMLAVMVRTTPAAAASTGSPLRKWLMMLGPPMAAAAAVALWFAVAQDHRTPVIDGLSKQAKAEAESAPPPVMPPLAPPALEEDRTLPPTSSDADLQRRERMAPQGLADARKEREALEPAAKTAIVAPATTGTAVAPATAGNEKKDLAAAKREDVITGSDRISAAAPAPVASRPAAPPPPAAPRPAESVQAAAGNRPAPAAVVPGPPPQQQANQAQNQSQNQAQNQAPNQNQVQTTAQSPAVQRQQAVEERVAVADKPSASTADAGAAASPVAGRGGASGGVADFAALSIRAKAGGFELVPSASTIRWRVVEGRIVQRSLDSGATWANQYTADSGVFLTAGTAPSSTVAWLVGRAGAIIVTSDGRSWQRVTFPEVADLTSVVAPDARSATVTTVDGRRFATADGGRTWTRQ